MSTEAIIVIAAIVLVALIAWALVKRMSGERRRQRAVAERREEAAVQEKSVAQERMTRAERAEQEARLAAQKAQQERAAAEQHATRATMHEEGHLDHEHEAAIDADGDGVRDDRESITSERDTTVGESNGRFERSTTTEETGEPRRL